MVNLTSSLTILSLVLLFNSCLIDSKPTEKTACSACEELVQFSRKLSVQMKDEQVRENVAKWCVESSFGANDKVCTFLINDLESILNQVESQRFCDGIKACPSSFFSKPHLTSGNSSVQCEFCLNTLTHIKEIVSSPQTINEVKLVLSSGCSALKDLQDECVKLLDENLDEIFQFIRQRFDPKLFCQETRSCPSKIEKTAEKKLPEITDLINIYPSPLADSIPEEGSLEAGPECVLCHLLLHIIAKELGQNKTIEEIEHSLNSTCGKVFRDEGKIEKCQERVEKYTRRFIDLATQGVAPEVACIIFGLCGIGEDEAYKCLNDPKVSCPICKQIVENIYSKLSENSTKEEIVEALDSVCKMTPPSQRTACEVYVKVYEEKLTELIKEAADSAEICRKLGLCEESIVEEILPPQELKNDLECEVCQKVFAYLYQYLQDNKTEEAIREALDKACDKLPQSRRKQCENFVDTYSEQIIDIVLQTTDPHEACELLKVCTSSSYVAPPQRDTEEVEVVPLVKISSKARPTIRQDGPGCDMCKKIFTTVHNIIVENGSSITEALDKVCQRIPDKERAKCEEMVEKYANELIGVLKSQTDPDIACVLLRLCPAGQTVEKVGSFDGEKEGERDENSVGSGILLDHEERNNEVEIEGSIKHSLCSECQAITKYIQEEMYDYKTEEDISNFIKNELCEHMSNAMVRDSCRSFITEYGDSIIQLVALKVFDPEVLCQKELKLCPNPTTPAPVPSSSVKSSDFDFNNPNSEETCTLCVNMVTKMESIMINEAPEKKRDDGSLGRKACEDEPEDKKAKCSSIFDAFGRHFIQMIGFDQPRKICSVVDLCFNSGNTHLLGGRKCTFGPTYWCHTAAHADACKATDFCKKKVWKPIE